MTTSDWGPSTSPIDLGVFPATGHSKQLLEYASYDGAQSVCTRKLSKNVNNICHACDSMTVKTKDDRGESKHVEGMAPSEASAFIPGAKPLIETLLVHFAVKKKGGE